MKSTPFAVIILALIAFLGVLSGVVLLSYDETFNNQSLLNQQENVVEKPENNSLTPLNQPIDNQTNISTNITKNQTMTINTTNQNNTINTTNQNNTINTTNQTQNGEKTTINTTIGTRNDTDKTYGVKNLYNLETPMRDGVKLISDVWMPREDGKYPVIIMRMMYGRSAYYMNYTGMGEYFASRGYVFMVQDVRGKGESQGNFDFIFQEGQDGYDTVEWAASQPWSNGRIGMMGFSYQGVDQWMAAREKPPHLVCIAPTASPGRYMEEIPSVGGVFYMGWALPWTTANNGLNQDLNVLGNNWTAAYNHRPLINADEVSGTQVPLYRQFLEHPTLDDYWKRIQFTDQDFNQISIPTMTTTGWFDTDQPGALFYWNGLKKNQKNMSDHYLIIGPWIHSGTFEPAAQTAKIGDLPIPGAQVDVYGNHLAFFDLYLKNSTSNSTTNLNVIFNSTNSINSNNSAKSNLNNPNFTNSTNSTSSSNKFDLPQVRVYLTGLSKWIEMTTYPPQDLNITPLYLGSGGQANTKSGNGFLSWSLSNTSTFANNNSNISNRVNTSNNSNKTILNTTSDSYTYDPANPRPVAMNSWVMDSRATENRSDVLVYTTPPLEESIVILGPVFVDLYAASDAKDTDFVARIVDVYPNGTAINLGNEEFGGAIRARFRQGFDKEVLLEPSTIEKYRIELFDIGHVFLPGHRIRLEISSSAYPLLHSNPNTGNPIATDTEQQIAHQTIYHDQQYPSAVFLPIIPSNSSLSTQIFG